MKKWFIGSLFVLITGVIIAFSIGFFTSSDTATRNVTITISGLPGDRTVDVWGSSFWGGSEKLTSFQSEQTVQQLVVPSKIDNLEVKSPIQEPGILISLKKRNMICWRLKTLRSFLKSNITSVWEPRQQREAQICDFPLPPWNRFSLILPATNMDFMTPVLR